MRGQNEILTSSSYSERAGQEQGYGYPVARRGSQYPPGGRPKVRLAFRFSRSLSKQAQLTCIVCRRGTDGQTDGRMDGRTGGRADWRTGDWRTGGQADWQRDRQTGRQAEKKADRQRDREADMETGTETKRYVYICVYMSNGILVQTRQKQKCAAFV